jgi:hypothetical protein
MCYNDGPLFFSRFDFLYSRLSLLICPIFLHHDMFTVFCMGSEMESAKSNWFWIWDTFDGIFLSVNELDNGVDDVSV